MGQYGGALLQGFGTSGLLVLMVFAVPVGINSVYRLFWSKQIASIGIRAESNKIPIKIPILISGFRRGKWVLAAFALMVLLRTIPQVTMITFLPKLFHDRGYSPAAYGFISSLFMAGYAMGGVSGGFLADRWGRRRTIFWTLIAAVVPMYFSPYNERNGPLSSCFSCRALQWCCPCGNSGVGTEVTSAAACFCIWFDSGLYVRQWGIWILHFWIGCGRLSTIPSFTDQ